MKKAMSLISLVCLLIVFNANAFAAEPIPSFWVSTSIFTPDDLVIESGGYIDINVGVINRGGWSPEGGISVSFPNFTSSSDINLLSFPDASTITPGTYPAGSTIHNNYGQDMTAQYMLVELTDFGWGQNDFHRLRIRVSPDQDNFKIYIRSAMQDETSLGWINGYPSADDTPGLSSSTTTDQQGWTVRTYNVTVNPGYSEDISEPTSITGPAKAYVGDAEEFTASGASSSEGHDVEYQFDWGDGSSLSDWTTGSASHTYTKEGSFGIKARARCGDHITARSSWSGVLHTVTVEDSIIEVPYQEHGDKPELQDLGNSQILIWNSSTKNLVSIQDYPNFDSSLAAVIIVHGWNKEYEDDINNVAWISEMASSLSEINSNQNIFVWDWLENAKSKWYINWLLVPTENVTPEQSNLAISLINLANISNAKSIHFIGHSLGAALSSRAAKTLLEKVNFNINVERVTLCDAPENWGPDTISKAVEIQDVVKYLKEKGVYVDNYISEFGDTYPDAENFWLKEASEGVGAPGGWGEDHGLSHAFYACSIKPDKESFPSGQEGSTLTKYFSYIDDPALFWLGVDGVGYNRQTTSSEIGKVWHSAKYIFELACYFPYAFENLNITPLNPVYLLVDTEQFEDVGLWVTDGHAYLKGQEAHIVTFSPSFLYQTKHMPENVSLLRFDYRFEETTPGDILYLYADDEPLWIVKANEFNSGIMQSSEWIDISHLAGKTVILSFALINLTENQAHCVVDNLEFVEKVSPNTAPIADAGPDQPKVEITNSTGAEVTMDGSGSSDPDGDSLIYQWTWNGGSASGVNPTVTLPMGLTTVTLTVSDGELSDSDSVNITVVDTTAPEVAIMVPITDAAVQDGVTLKAQAADLSEITNVTFTIREVNVSDSNGTPVGFENLAAVYNAVSGQWEYAFNSTQLPDGYYQIFAKAVDEYGNEGTSEVVPFSIRNWAVVKLLPMSARYNPGRTVPIKFSLRISEAVDPAMPFVYNEDLEIRIFETSKPGTILQSSLFGDSSTDYRISVAGEQYITNYKTGKTPASYTVQVRRTINDFFVDDFDFKTIK